MIQYATHTHTLHIPMFASAKHISRSPNTYHPNTLRRNYSQSITARTQLAHTSHTRHTYHNTYANTNRDHSRRTVNRSRRQMSTAHHIRFVFSHHPSFRICVSRLCTHHSTQFTRTHRPLLVITISVPSLWNFSHSSLPSSVTFGSSTTPSSSGCIFRIGRIAGCI